MRTAPATWPTRAKDVRIPSIWVAWSKSFSAMYLLLAYPFTAGVLVEMILSGVKRESVSWPMMELIEERKKSVGVFDAVAVKLIKLIKPNRSG